MKSKELTPPPCRLLSYNPVFSVRISPQTHPSLALFVMKPGGRQCQHVNRNVIHVVAAPLVMLSTPATGSQANKVANRGNRVQGPRRRTLKGDSTFFKTPLHRWAPPTQRASLGMAVDQVLYNPEKFWRITSWSCHVKQDLSWDKKSLGMF